MSRKRREMGDLVGFSPTAVFPMTQARNLGVTELLSPSPSISPSLLTNFILIIFRIHSLSSSLPPP